MTDHGRPVLRIDVYADDEDTLETLQGVVQRYDDPTGPFGESDRESPG